MEFRKAIIWLNTTNNRHVCWGKVSVQRSAVRCFYIAIKEFRRIGYMKLCCIKERSARPLLIVLFSAKYHFITCVHDIYFVNILFFYSIYYWILLNIWHEIVLDGLFTFPRVWFHFILIALLFDYLFLETIFLKPSALSFTLFVATLSHFSSLFA